MKKIGFGALLAGAALVIIGVLVNQKESATIGIIGGADGPTSILVAGPSVSAVAIAGMMLGVMILLAGAAIIWKKRK